MDCLLTECCKVLDILFRNTVSTHDYHQVVACMRHIMERYGYESVARAMPSICETHGWPLNYNPFDHMENIRFGLTFDTQLKARPETILLMKLVPRVDKD